MKQDFLQYIQETFQFSESDMEQFQSSLSKPLKKTIRVNTHKISIPEFTQLAEKNNWILTPTSLGENIFYIDRTNDLDIALGNTMEHLNGYFYVQELAASSSPYYMSGDQRDDTAYTILDMSASPGGKTTQLSEYYPNSIIIANELDKSRLKGLFSNIDRMGWENICVTNYDGRFFKNTPELFDKVLLDAPCSGEWTAFKTDDALKFWNLKNIKRIAKLQFWLLEAAAISLKVGGELVYSTCTLNTLENEENIEKFLKKYSDYFEIIPLQKKDTTPGEKTYIRNRPHQDGTGWFFVAKLRKLSSIPRDTSAPKVHQNYEKLSSKDTSLVSDFYEKNFQVHVSKNNFYSYRWEVYMTEKNISELWEKLFFYQIGRKIGYIENGQFIPYFYGWLATPESTSSISLEKTDIHTLYKGEEINTEKQDGYYEVFVKDISGGIVKIKSNTMKTLLDTGRMRNI